ncbi:WD40-repeat-containing domain protein [Hyaloraphidium curvatum]|nr:WD40-repeat-containing domain protein [Hyaloraphidium curvatum]
MQPEFNAPPQQRHKEVYSHRAPWPIYSLHWSQRPGVFRLGLGSCVEEYGNRLQVVQLPAKGEPLVPVASADHPYPATKLMWTPAKGQAPELMATTGDYLRIWDFRERTDMVDPPPDPAGRREQVEPCVLTMKATLANIRRSGQSQGKKDLCAPLTSFDWNDTDPSMIVTSSIDTTCTVWDINAQQAKTQLIAHDKEVFDVAFARGTDIFASVGADGSVRMFDLRSLEHSTIMYETPPLSYPSSSPQATSSAGAPAAPDNSPLLRISWNKQDPNYIATFQIDSPQVIILDIRVPAVPVTELVGHVGYVNAVQWAPQSSGHIVTAGDDAQALVWEIVAATKGKPIHDPILAYTAESEINQLSWNASQPEWIAVAFGDTVQALRV